MAEKTYQIPKTLGAVADKIYELQLARSELQRKVDALEAHEKFLKDHVVEHLSKQDAKGVSGKRANVKVLTSQVPSVKDWDKFYAHVLKTKDFSLMQRRVSNPAVQERWDAGKTVPGVETFTVVKVSVTKVR